MKFYTYSTKFGKKSLNPVTLIAGPEQQIVRQREESEADERAEDVEEGKAQREAN